MKTDAQIQSDVIAELKWQPFLKASDIGVSVHEGIVTLTGMVNSYSKKIAAENATRKVAGVRAIAEDIQIGVSPFGKKSDAEIAEAVLNALKWHTAVSQDKIRIKVENGNVRLEGNVEWEYQKTAAETAISDLEGVKSVINIILVTPKVQPYDIEQKISAAFHRSASVDARKIQVDVSGGKVTLTGRVRSYSKKEMPSQQPGLLRGLPCSTANWRSNFQNMP